MPLDRIEKLGAAALTEKEEAAALIVKGCVRYICRSGGIGAILDEFSTPEEKTGWAASCKVEAKTSELPE